MSVTRSGTQPRVPLRWHNEGFANKKIARRVRGARSGGVENAEEMQWVRDERAEADGHLR